MLLDEWQEVPDVLGAVKRAVDSRQGAGRFLLTGSVRARSAWLTGYVEELVERDVPALARVRSPRRLGLPLRAVALSTAGSPTEATLAESVGVDARTLGSYLDLLEDLKVIERVPACYSPPR